MVLTHILPVPGTDCEVSDWDSWSKCAADNGKCGIGTQQRLRTVVREAERGGTECPPLKEMKTCFVDCQPKKRAEDGKGLATKT